LRREAGRSAATTGHAVVIAGGGPTGLMLTVPNGTRSLR
jgi:predicted Rossmann-fold nucleotide-binding protein